MIRRLPVLQMVLISLLGILAYANTFNASFHFDDAIYITNYPTPPAGAGMKLHFPSPNIMDFSCHMDSSKAGQLDPELARHPYFRTRFFGYLTLWLNYQWGGLNVTGYHVVNLAVHIANALLVYWLVMLCFRTPALRDAEPAPLLALFAGSLFVAHPMQTEAVTYISQRFVELAATFYLLCIVAYVASRTSTTPTARWTFYGVSLGAAVLAMMTKEIALTLPVMVAVCEFLFFRGPVLARLIRVAPFVLPVLNVVLAYVTQAPGGEAGAGMEGLTRFQTDTSRADYLWTQLTVIPTYLRLLVWPVGQNVDWERSLHHSFFEWTVVVSSLVLLAIVALAGLLLARSTHRPQLRLAAFGILWFFIALAVESGLVPFSVLMVEYRVYLPSVGFMLAAAALLLSVRDAFCSGQASAAKLITGLLVALPLILAASTYARNRVWKDDVSFWEDVVRKSPKGSRPYLNLGKAYRAQGRTDDAIACYEKALKLDPTDVMALNNLANAYTGKGRLDEAIGHYRKLLTLGLEPMFSAEIHYNLGLVLEKKGLAEEAETHYKQAIALNPWNLDAHNNLGSLYLAKQKTDTAIECFRAALSRDPGYVNAHFNLGCAYWQKKMADEAIQHYRIFLQARPDYAEAHRNLAEIYQAKGLVNEAEQHLRAAKALERPRP